MSRNQFACKLVALLGLAICGTPLFAQKNYVGDPRPRSSVGGYAGNEMRNIYTQDVGRGYTSQSLNAIALDSARARVENVGQSAAGLGSGGSIGLTSPPRLGKPFSSVSQAPTTSPYLNLFREGIGEANDFDYQTLVRPQIQQQQMNQQFERQQLELARRVQKISAQSDYKNAAGAEDQYPTGHHTVFGQYGHYYPTINQTVKKR